MATSGLKDSQKEKLYQWESEFPYWHLPQLSKKDCIKSIRWACDLYKVPYPKKIGFHPNKYGYSISVDLPQYRISLQTNGMNAATCLHEVAHLIHGYITGQGTISGHEDHGPEWLAIYVWLLIKAGVLSRRAVECSLRDIGLKWIDPASRLSPRSIRKSYRSLYLKEQKRQKESLSLS